MWILWPAISLAAAPRFSRDARQPRPPAPRQTLCQGPDNSQTMTNEVSQTFAPQPAYSPGAAGRVLESTIYAQTYVDRRQPSGGDSGGGSQRTPTRRIC